MNTQELAVRHTHEKRAVYDVHWESALPHLEAYLAHTPDHSFAHRPSQETERLLSRVANNGEFMLALVFSRDHQSVTVLPLPEIFQPFNHSRVPLSYTKETAPCSLEEIDKKVHVLLTT